MWGGALQGGHLRRGLRQVFKIVEQEQQLPVLQPGCHAGQDGLRAQFGQSKGRSNRWQQQVRSVERGQPDKDHALGKHLLRPVCDLQRQPRLADAARAGQGEQPHIGPA